MSHSWHLKVRESFLEGPPVSLHFSLLKGSEPLLPPTDHQSPPAAASLGEWKSTNVGSLCPSTHECDIPGTLPYRNHQGGYRNVSKLWIGKGPKDWRRWKEQLLSGIELGGPQGVDEVKTTTGIGMWNWDESLLSESSSTKSVSN